MVIIKSLENSFTYKEYRNFVSQLLLEGLSTGATQSEDLTHYTTLNEVRMNRLDKTIAVSQHIKDSLESLENNYIWLLISEGWCGDAAQIVPVINKMSELAKNIELKIVLRDDNEDLMNMFLTNGAKSIPKLILLEKESLNVLGSWGPRPEGAVQLIKDYKEKFGVIDDTAKTELQKWYLNDKGLSTQKEILSMITDLRKKEIVN